MSEPVLELRGVRKSFGAKVALRGVDLELGRGEILGFVGPNGAGKSTCLRICLGLVARDGGDVAVLGYDPARDGLEIRRRCAYLPGEKSIYDRMTGRDFVAFALHGYAVDNTALEVGGDLSDLPLGARIRSYSAGMKQRLALRATLCADVPVLILDEPDRALDATARMQLRAVLRALRERGRSVLLSSHHLSEIEAVADRTQFLLDGSCVPEERIEAARETLRFEVRLRLKRDVELPDGTTSVRTSPDGGLRVRTEDDPIRWLARVPADAVSAAEVGATRLEDLYRELTGVETGEAR